MQLRSGKTVNKATRDILVTVKTTGKVVASSRRRSPRNYKKVDYTGMDTIEPESEYDGITDIWYDDSYYSDSDYEPEEEEEYTQVNITSNVNAEMQKIVDNSETKCKDNSNNDYQDYGYGEEINKALAKTYEVFRRAREESQQKKGCVENSKEESQQNTIIPTKVVKNIIKKAI